MNPEYARFFRGKRYPRPVWCVRWLDATTMDDTYADNDDTHHGGPTITVGFLVRSDRDGITVTTDVQLPDPHIKGDEPQFRGKHFIPRGMILDAYPLTRGKI